MFPSLPRTKNGNESESLKYLLVSGICHRGLSETTVYLDSPWVESDTVTRSRKSTKNLRNIFHPCYCSRSNFLILSTYFKDQVPVCSEYHLRVTYRWLFHPVSKFLVEENKDKSSPVLYHRNVVSKWSITHRLLKSISYNHQVVDDAFRSEDDQQEVKTFQWRRFESKRKL